MTHDKTDLETRLRGALQEIADRAPTAPHLDSLSAEQDDQPDPVVRSHRSPGWVRPALAAAVVTAIVGGAGVVAATQLRTGPGPDDADVNSPAAGEGTTPAPASNPSVEARQVVDDVAAKLTAHELDKGFGKVAVDYEAGARCCGRARLPPRWRQSPKATPRESVSPSSSRASASRTSSTQRSSYSILPPRHGTEPRWLRLCPTTIALDWSWRSSSRGLAQRRPCKGLLVCR